MTHIYHRRKPLSLVSLFAVIFLVVAAPILTILLRPKSAEAAWFDDSWEYRKVINIPSHTSLETNVYVTVPAFDATDTTRYQSDCGNLRFTDVGGKLLQYYVVDCDATANIHVLFDSLPAGASNYYMYYGHPTAPNGFVSADFTTAATGLGSQAAASEENTPGPVVYWSFDEGQGLVNGDSSGNGRNGSNNDGNVWEHFSGCISGSCVLLNNQSADVRRSYDSTADQILNVGTGNFSFSIWSKRTVPPASTDFLVARASGAAGAYGLYMNTSGNYCFGIDDDISWGPDDSVCSTSTYVDYTWHFITSVRSGNTLYLYIDGRLDNQFSPITATGSLSGTNNTLVVGNRCVTTCTSFGPWNGGFADEFRLYNYARSASQILSDFNSRGTAQSAAVLGVQKDKPTSTLDSHLIGYWFVDPTGGEIDEDRSGYDHQLTFVNSLGSTPHGKYGFGGAFASASSKYARAADTVPLSITGSLTLAAWIKPSSNTDGTQYDIAGKWDGSDESYLLAQYGDEIRMYIDASGNYVETTSANLATSTWYHIVAVYDAPAQTVSIYINGASVGTSTTGTIPTSITDDTGRFHLGAEDSTTSAANFFDGTMDEVRLYNRALSSQEVVDLLTIPLPPAVYFPLDEGQGTTIRNHSVFNFTADLDNLAAWTLGKSGQGVFFNGNTSRIYGNLPNETQIHDNLTISLWVFRTTTARNDYLVTNYASATANSYVFKIDTSNQLFLSWYNGSSTITITSSTAVSAPAGTWVHYAVTRNTDTNEVRFYQNGVQLGTTQTFAGTSTSSSGAQYFNVGCYSTCSAGGSGFSGKLDEVRIYTYARTAKQIVEDMNAGHPAGGSPIGSQAVYWKFDEGQGTTANNSGFASSSNGTLTSIASPATSTSGWTFTGKVNKGIVFDGTDDNVVIATANDAAVDFATTEQFSASAWVYVTTMPGSGNQDAFIAKWDETGNLAAYKLYVENDDADTTGNFEVQIYDESASQAITASQVIDQVAVNTWYHVAFTFNGGVAGAAGDLKLYVNGNLTAQNAANASFLGLEDLASDFTVGDYDAGDAVANNTAFTGTIDEVKVYSGLLTQSEIQVDMNAGSAAAMGGVLGTQNNEGFGGNPPVGWWKLDDNTGTTAVDSSGNGNNGSFVGNPTWGSGCKIGGCLKTTVNGVGDHVAITDPASGILDFSNAQDYTISVWINITVDDLEDNFPIWKGGSSASTIGYAIDIDASSATDPARCVYNDGIGGTRGDLVDSLVDVVDGQWHFISCVMDRDGSEVGTAGLHVFVDGILRASDTSLTEGSAAANTNDVRLGERNATNELTGLTDDARIYNYARTPAQVAYDYNRGAPVAWYKFDECQGATAYNAATNANGQAAGMNGTITPGSLGNTAVGDCTTSGSTMWFNGATGKYNSSLDFDASDDYVTVTNASGIDFNEGLQNGFTISSWIFADTDGETDVGRIFTKNANTYCRTDSQSGSNLDIECQLDLTTTDRNVNVSSAITTGTWNHVAFTWTNDSDDDVTVWINGKSRGSSSANSNDTMITDTANLIIGTDSTSATTTFDGDIDQFQIFNYEMTAGQIQRLYNEGAAQRFGPQTGSP